MSAPRGYGVKLVISGSDSVDDLLRYHKMNVGTAQEHVHSMICDFLDSRRRQRDQLVSRIQEGSEDVSLKREMALQAVEGLASGRTQSYHKDVAPVVKSLAQAVRRLDEAQRALGEFDTRSNAHDG